MDSPRLTRGTLRVLHALLQPGGPYYGLAVIRATGLPSGSVYPILNRLEYHKWLTNEWEWPPHDSARNHAEGRPPRRYYHFTQAGRAAAEQALEAERQALA